jgi:hypothetical protein
MGVFGRGAGHRRRASAGWWATGILDLRAALPTEAAFGTVFGLEAICSSPPPGRGASSWTAPTRPRPLSGRMTMLYDVVVVGGGPSGATAAEDLARSGHKVALIDRAGGSSPAAVPSRPA